MAFDLARTRYSLTEELPLAPGVAINEEGAVVKAILVSGKSAAQLTEGTSATESIVGFSENNALVPDQDIVTEAATIPAAGAVTVQLSHGNLVSGQVYVYDVTASAPMTDVLSGSPTTGQVLVNIISGLLTFNAAQAGHLIQVRYRYNLTIQQRDIIYRQRPVNAKSNTAQLTVTVMRGNGNVFTDQYDVTKDFSTASTLYADANGLVTTDNTKTPILGSRVISVPTAADKFLGFAFNLA